MQADENAGFFKLAWIEPRIGYLDLRRFYAFGEAKDMALALIPMKQMGEAPDVAKAVAFLASDAAGYITGQVLSVDGGMHT